MKSSVSRKTLTKYFDRWLAKRQPAAQAVMLRQGEIYILPTRFGWWFVFLILLLYLLGTNYQNNLLLLLSFIFFSLFISSMLLTFLNLYQLKIYTKQDHECYAAENTSFPLHLTNHDASGTANSHRARQMLSIRLKGQRLVQLLPTLSHETIFMLQLPQLSRGCYPLPRLMISSVYPLGLFRAWSYPALMAQIWVYPQPLEQNDCADRNKVLPEGEDSVAGSEPDYLKAYQQGDSLKRIVWKKLATSPQQPVIRALNQQNAPLPEWVIVPPVQGATLEKALSEACFTLLQLEQQQKRYGLKLPLLLIEPGSGPAHLQRCLQELALC